MVNDTNNSKLDQAVKESLTKLEAPYDASDWAKMESMLESAPASGNFKWSYVINIFIGLAVLAGAYLLYHSFNSSKNIPQTINDSIPTQPVQNNVTTVTTKPVTIPTPVAPVPSKPTINIQPIESNPPAPTKTPVITKIENVQKEISASEKTKITTTNNVVAEEKEKKLVKKQQVVNPMGNEPIFGDMLDSSKGIVGKTKEKEETKKAAKKTQPDQPIGWGSFLSPKNLDSLKKYHEQQLKDSIKK